MPAPVAAPKADQLLGYELTGSRWSYRLEEVLGAGAMGAVYRAVTVSGKTVAVKVVRPGLFTGTHARERFFREAAISAQLDSPYVIPTEDFGDDAKRGVMFIAMPYLCGQDLAELLGKFGPLDPQLAAKLVYQAALGVAAVHRVGIIHRDVKPSNIFCEQTEHEVQARVFDFGLAKRVEMYDDSHLTRTGSSMGSPLYMSPEQVQSSKHADERSDVWGLAAVLYELLSGVSPHGDASSLPDLLIRITQRNVPSIQGRAPWVSPELAQVVHRGLCRTSTRRQNNAAEFASALAAAVPDCHARIDPSDLHSIPEAVRMSVAPEARLDDWFSSDDGGYMTSVCGIPTLEYPLVGRTVAGKYRVLRPLGRGAMGCVYEAESADGSRIALKIMSASAMDQDQGAITRFEREARAALSIRSPNVVTAFDAGSDPTERVLFIAMELLRGNDLGVQFRRVGPLSPDVLVRIISQAAHGIQAAHDIGIVHRDVKPANLFLSVSRETHRINVKVCDFGVAKQTTATQGSGRELTSLTQTGNVLGSPKYMSPEQAMNARTVDARTDVWSLGLCFYEGLTGRLPWGDYESVYQTIIAVCEQPVTWIQDVAPWVGSELADVVHRMLAREPSERYQTMFDVVQALCPFTNGDDGFEREELRGVDAETRLLVARRPSVRLRLSSAQGAKPNSSARLRAFAGQRSRWLSLGGGLIATAIVAMSSWLLLRPSEPDPASRIPSRSEASGSVLAGVNPKKPPTVASTPVSTLPGPTISAAGAAVAFSGRSRDLARGHSAKAPGLRVQQQPQPLPSSNGTGAQTGQELAEQPSTKKPSYIEQLPLE